MAGAREAAYPAFVLKRRAEGQYNDAYDINFFLGDDNLGGTTKRVAMTKSDRFSTNEGSEAPLLGSAGKTWDLKTVGKQTTTESSELGKDDLVEEATHHKRRRIPVSKMPPYHIDCSSEGGLKPTSCNGTIDFSNISFSYPSRPQVKVLNEFNLHVTSGKTVALVGQSGCGKSSVMSLMERFYDVDSDDGFIGDEEQGRFTSGIKLDGVDLRELNVSWLRSQIGLV